MNKPNQTIDLPFSAKYDRAHAEEYRRKHGESIARRISNARDAQLARKALKLAGDPQHVVDLPCGTGRFWPVLLENPKRTLIAADNSDDMLAVAAQANPEAVRHGVRLLRTSAFAIDLPDQSTDCIFSMRLLHHIGKSEDRLTMLREFHRVTRETVIVSLWVDGNFKAWRRHRLEARRGRTRTNIYQNRFVVSARQIEQEFESAGFVVRDYSDFLPHYAMWRVYVLEKITTH